MFKNYLKIAVRNILRQRIYSIINIIGLAIGIACCIAIVLYVRDELSYDRFNKNADQIYRVHYHTYFNNKDFDLANSCAPLEPTLVKDFPEVVAAARIANFGFPVIRYKDKAFSEEKFYEADSTFFNVFTVHFIEGNPGTALVQPYTVVITETTARKYFGNENPMGKILNLDNRQNYIVTGVVKGFPNNAHFHFDFLASLTGNADSRNQIWLSNNYYTYILLHKNTDPSAFEKKLNQDIRKYIGPQLKSATGVTFDQFESAGNRVGFFLQPLTSIHLNSHLDYEIQPNGDVSYVYIFSAIAIAILLIACINFMNLSTARSDRRAREVGIRKALGSRRGQLIMQFMAESIITSLIAVLLSIGIVEMLLPLFNNISGKGLSMGIFDKLYTFPLLILFAFVVGITAGSYPAFYLSSFIPVQVLKSDRRKGSRKSLLRSTLVISQFAVSIALFVSTFIVYSQLKYIQEKNLGFDKEQVVVINKTDDLGTQIESFKQELLANPEIRNVSNSNAIPGNQYGDDVFQPEGGKANDAQNIRTMSCDNDFAKVYRIEMAAGRFFSLDHPSDTTAVVMNEAALKVLGIKDPVGKNLVAVKINPANSRRFEIIGVTKDFNYESLHQVVRPLVINLFGSNGFGKFISVRIAPGDHQKTISFLENTWKKYAGNEAFEYNFLDQDLRQLYVVDQRAGEIAATFSVLAILIACLGLLGLAAFITEQRTKEIGIRKVLGASTTEVIILLTAEFGKWVLISNIIAWPVAYFLMNSWLKDFAYRINISFWVFAVAGVLALVIALLTVSSHAFKAAKANPVNALKYE